MTVRRCRFMWEVGACSRALMAAGLILLAFVALWFAGVK